MQGAPIRRGPTIMNAANLRPLEITVACAALIEAVTGLALVDDPALVVRLLLGSDAAVVDVLLGRFLGLALFALALACWPAFSCPQDDAPGARAMRVYNLLVALYLAYVGATYQAGILLWPAIALHAWVARALLSSRYGKSPQRLTRQ
jgi:hypothetical protein